MINSPVQDCFPYGPCCYATSGVNGSEVHHYPDICVLSDLNMVELAGSWVGRMYPPRTCRGMKSMGALRVVLAPLTPTSSPCDIHKSISLWLFKECSACMSNYLWCSPLVACGMLKSVYILQAIWTGWAMIFMLCKTGQWIILNLFIVNTDKC